MNFDRDGPSPLDAIFSTEGRARHAAGGGNVERSAAANRQHFNLSEVMDRGDGFVAEHINRGVKVSGPRRS